MYSISHYLSFLFQEYRQTRLRIRTARNRCTSQLLSLSSALEICLKATSETIAFVREKDELLAAIDRSSPSPSVPDDLHSANDQNQDDAALEIEPQSDRINLFKAKPKPRKGLVPLMAYEIRIAGIYPGPMLLCDYRSRF